MGTGTSPIDTFTSKPVDLLLFTTHIFRKYEWQQHFVWGIGDLWSRMWVKNLTSTSTPESHRKNGFISQTKKIKELTERKKNERTKPNWSLILIIIINFLSLRSFQLGVQMRKEAQVRAEDLPLLLGDFKRNYTIIIGWLRKWQMNVNAN